MLSNALNSAGRNTVFDSSLFFPPVAANVVHLAIDLGESKTPSIYKLRKQRQKATDGSPGVRESRGFREFRESASDWIEPFDCC
jgi:hypothetical protein